MRDGQNPDDKRRRRHRALANRNRIAILRLLEDAPQDVATLADATGLHPNTVRAHLDVLVDGGLVRRVTGVATGRGRPALVYAPVTAAHADGTQPPDPAIIGVLADALRRTAEDATGAAEAAGRRWGQQVVGDEPPVASGPAVGRIVELLDQQGFAPEVAEDDPPSTSVLLHACPYLELAKEHGEVICALHLGLLRGALAHLGGSVHAELRPFVNPDLCIAELSVAS